MAQAARLNLRMQKEIKLLVADPPPGVSFPFLSHENNTSSALSTIEAQLRGPERTVYSDGLFTLIIQIPERYPFQPPNVTFVTPIYHPNIDNGGRICLDILNLPPKGAWQPSLNISTVLTSIGLLLSEPNPDDGLMAEASREYKYNRTVFDEKAQYWTHRYANPETAEKVVDEGLLPNLKLEARRQHLSLAKFALPEVSNSQLLSDKTVGETVESRKKMRLMGGKLSLKSPSPFRMISCEDIQGTAANQLPSMTTERIVEDDMKIASIQMLPTRCEDRISVGLSRSLVQEKCGEVQEIPADIATIIVSDSEESDNEVEGPYKCRPFLFQKRTK